MNEIDLTSPEVEQLAVLLCEMEEHYGTLNRIETFIALRRTGKEPARSIFYSAEMMKAFDHGIDALRSLQAREKLAYLRARAALRKFIEEHPDAFKALKPLLGPADLKILNEEQIINNPNNNEHEENKPG